MNTDADAGWTPKKMTASLRINLKDHHTTHLGVSLPLCKYLNWHPGDLRWRKPNILRGVNCPKCRDMALSGKRQLPWESWAVPHKRRCVFVREGVVCGFEIRSGNNPIKMWDLKTRRAIRMTP